MLSQSVFFFLPLLPLSGTHTSFHGNWLVCVMHGNAVQSFFVLQQTKPGSFPTGSQKCLFIFFYFFLCFVSGCAMLNAAE